MSSPEGFHTASLFLALRPSRWQAGLLAGVFVAGMIAIWSNELLGMPLAAFLSLALLLSCGQFAWRDVLRYSPDAVIGLNYGDGHWHLRLKDGRIKATTFRGAVFTGRWFIVLAFSKGLVVLSADTMDAATWRRLRVLFRLGGIAVVQPNDGGVKTVSVAEGSRSG